MSFLVWLNLKPNSHIDADDIVHVNMKQLVHM